MARLVGEHFTREGRPKRAFKTFLEAQSWGYEHGLVAYECTFCGSWHLATKSDQPAIEDGKRRRRPKPRSRRL